jgi:CheY-like chemotaxis protein
MSEVVLVVNTAPDTVELLTRMFEQFDFLVLGTYTHDVRYGRTDLAALVEQHRPVAVVYDLAPPYLRNWQFCQHLRQHVLNTLPLVFTSTNASLASKILHPDKPVYELQESPESLAAILRAVTDAVKAG